MTEAIIVKLSPAEGCFDELLQLLADLLDQTRAFDGCTMAHVYHCHESNEIVLVQNWQSSAAHDAYLNWRAEEGIFDQIAELLSDEQIHKSYRAL